MKSEDMARARRVADRTTVRGVPDALPATSEPIDLTLSDKHSIESELRRISRPIPKNDDPGFGHTGFGSGSTSPTSKTSEKPSTDSKKRWRKPHNVREFAAQANAVATMLLNGDLDIDTARTYSSLARGVAQMMSINVTRARFLKEEPVLDFEEDE